MSKVICSSCGSITTSLNSCTTCEKIINKVEHVKFSCCDCGVNAEIDLAQTVDFSEYHMRYFMCEKCSTNEAQPCREINATVTNINGVFTIDYDAQCITCGHHWETTKTVQDESRLYEGPDFCGPSCETDFMGLLGESDYDVREEQYKDETLYQVDLDTLYNEPNEGMFQSPGMIEFMETNGIHFGLVQWKGPGGGWPIVRFTGNRRALELLCLEHYDENGDLEWIEPVTK